MVLTLCLLELVTDMRCNLILWLLRDSWTMLVGLSVSCEGGRWKAVSL